jgi:hypothetical protein
LIVGLVVDSVGHWLVVDDCDQWLDDVITVDVVVRILVVDDVVVIVDLHIHHDCNEEKVHKLTL